MGSSRERTGSRRWSTSSVTTDGGFEAAMAGPSPLYKGISVLVFCFLIAIVTLIYVYVTLEINGRSLSIIQRDDQAGAPCFSKFHLFPLFY